MLGVAAGGRADAAVGTASAATPVSTRSNFRMGLSFLVVDAAERSNFVQLMSRYCLDGVTAPAPTAGATGVTEQPVVPRRPRSARRRHPRGRLMLLGPLQRAEDA